MSRSSSKKRRDSRTHRGWRRWFATQVPERRVARAVSNSSRSVLHLEHLEQRVVLASFIPTIFTDSAALDSGSLRAAVLEANANGDATNLITLPTGTYNLTLAGAGEDAGLSGDLDLTAAGKTLTIRGAGPGAAAIDASALADRVFHIVNAGMTVFFEDLTIRGGIARDGGNPSAVASLGGGVLSNGGNVTLDNVAVDANQALGGSAPIGVPVLRAGEDFILRAGR